MSVHLHVERAGPADGPPVILLHGFPEYHGGWRKQVGPLAAAGLRVIVPDLRGYGQSNVPTGIDAYRVEALAADIVALADAEGIARFTLVGHDWGGCIAWAVAAWHPDRVARLVILNAPHLDVMKVALRRDPRQMLRSWYVAFFQLPRLPERLLSRNDYAALKGALLGARGRAVTKADLAPYVVEWSRPGRLTAMLNYYRALRRPGRPLGRIAPPTLILWGQRDIALGFDLAEASLALCDDGELRAFPDATHWIQHEEPQAVADAIVAFAA